MTAQGLIQQLQTIPPTTKIVVRGYEDGYNNIVKLKAVTIKAKTDSHWYDGEFESSDDSDAIDAIDLYGENKNAKDEI